MWCPHHHAASPQLTVLALPLQLCLVPTNHCLHCTSCSANQPGGPLAQMQRDLWQLANGSASTLGHQPLGWHLPEVAQVEAFRDPWLLLPLSSCHSAWRWPVPTAWPCPKDDRSPVTLCCHAPDTGGPRTIRTPGSTGTLGLGTVRTMAVLSGIQRWQEASKGFHEWMCLKSGLKTPRDDWSNWLPAHPADSLRRDTCAASLWV